VIEGKVELTKFGFGKMAVGLAQSEWENEENTTRRSGQHGSENACV